VILDWISHSVCFAFLGFIDFIVEPTFSLLTDSTEKIVIPLIEEASKSQSSNYGASRYNRSSFAYIKGFTQ
jgi:calcium/calmodulin-dependent 3',5'-cyclic nucleotide phosphodiesterase